MPWMNKIAELHGGQIYRSYKQIQRRRSSLDECRLNLLINQRQITEITFGSFDRDWMIHIKGEKMDQQ